MWHVCLVPVNNHYFVFRVENLLPYPHFAIKLSPYSHTRSPDPPDISHPTIPLGPCWTQNQMCYSLTTYVNVHFIHVYPEVHSTWTHVKCVYEVSHVSPKLITWAGLIMQQISWASVFCSWPPPFFLYYLLHLCYLITNSVHRSDNTARLLHCLFGKCTQRQRQEGRLVAQRQLVSNVCQAQLLRRKCCSVLKYKSIFSL